MINRLYHRLMMLVGIGKVTGISSDTGSIQKLQYRTPLDVVSVPRMAEFGFSSAPPVGSDVVIVSLGGDRSSQVIIATNHQESRQTGLNAGETVIYSQTGQMVKLTATGITVEANAQPVTVSNATTVTVQATKKIVAQTPLLECTGDIVDNSGSNSTTLKQLRDAYDAHTHELLNVQSGDSSLTTEKPGTTV